MSEMENPASTGMLDGADSEIAGCDDGVINTATVTIQYATISTSAIADIRSATISTRGVS
jgi:hypothetical protein